MFEPMFTLISGQPPYSLDSIGSCCIPHQNMWTCFMPDGSQTKCQHQIHPHRQVTLSQRSQKTPASDFAKDDPPTSNKLLPWRTAWCSWKILSNICANMRNLKQQGIKNFWVDEGELESNTIIFSATPRSFPYYSRIISCRWVYSPGITRGFPRLPLQMPSHWQIISNPIILYNGTGFNNIYIYTY